MIEQFFLLNSNWVDISSEDKTLENHNNYDIIQINQGDIQ